MTVPALQPVLRRRIPALAPLSAVGAFQLARDVRADDVRQELVDESLDREERRLRRECRGSSGLIILCGGCSWVLRSAAKACPRCGYTDGYGYPR